MPRPRRNAARTTESSRGGSRDRHGRGIRSQVTGPHLPPLRTRLDFFDLSVGSAVEYVRSAWPDDLGDVRFDIAAYPNGDIGTEAEPRVARWRVDRARRRITLYRLPIQRLSKLHRDDEMHQRMMIESCVFRAVAELLDKDPWDISPDRFNHF